MGCAAVWARPPLCGLDRPDAGTATIDGHPYARLPQPGRRVGVMLDPGAMHRGRTGRETAAVWIALPGLAGGWHVLHRPVNA